MSWTIIYSSNQAHLVEIVKNILDSNSIEFVTVDKTDSSYGSALGSSIELYIRSEDFIRSKKLIAEFEHE
ncbi:MAG TPA: hypothetical protein DCX54_05180 [Flavobacteriales bacterium]|nr:hypothetical protein [Flavobacteriales bacterium]